MEYRQCAKCKQIIYVHKHPILPKSTFGENDEIDWLCPNCHTEYHQKLGSENLKNPDMAFHFYFYNKWKYGLLALLILLVFLRLL
jgi:hypothetical protein